jgi:peptidoglycan/xylan/chitin deacetylase (PgdA/CDA1 family)
VKKLSSRNVTALILIELIILLSPALVHADASTGSITLSVKHQSGDLVSSHSVRLEVYQDTDPNPYMSLDNVTAIPYTISHLPLNHSYKVEVYENSMHSGYGIITLDGVQKDLEITIPDDEGIQFNVYYNDAVTPISGAEVHLKSFDGIEWMFGTSDKNGLLPIMWVGSTTSDTDHYYADIVLGPNTHYVFTPIPPKAGKQVLNIVTNWPPVVENLITVKVYKSPTDLVTTSDGNLGIELRDLGNNKVLSSPVNSRGEAYMSKMKVGDYYLYVVNDPNNSAGHYKELTSRKVSIVGSENVIQVFINNPELNGNELNCKCVAFRLDDIVDYHLNSVEMAIIKEFQDKNASLTLGIEGQHFGQDQKLVSYIVSLVKKGNPVLEPAIHSWDHRDMTLLSKDEQFAEINQTSVSLQHIFGSKPQTFIPPYNHFNNVTLDLLKAYGITHISYHIHTQQPPPFTKSTLYHFPATTSTASVELQNIPPWTTVVADNIFADIKKDIPYYGYAVVGMHPYEFSSFHGAYVNTPNMTQISQLGLIIDKVQQAGYRIVPIEDIDKINSPPPKVPTQVTVPTPSVTQGCNCLAFRLDYVLDHSLTNVQLAIIKLFQDKGVDLTVGVMGKEIGGNATTVHTLTSMLSNNNPTLKLANRGWQNLDHTQFDKEIQSASINKTEGTISRLFSVHSSIFIPPYDKFDNNTIKALQENGIGYISSTVHLDSGPYNVQNDGTFHVPETNTVPDLLLDDPFYKGTIDDKALAKIEASLTHYGFSVASIRAQDFAVKSGSGYSNQVDSGNLKNLETLVDFLKSNNIKMVTLDDIPGEVNSKKFPRWVNNIYTYYEKGDISADDLSSAINYLNFLFKFNH